MKQVKFLKLEIAKTDMKNIKYTLELFVDMAGNNCKKNVMKSLKSRNNTS